MQRFLFIIQTVLKCGLIFLIAFIWLRFFLSSLWLASIISLGITVLIEFLSIYLKNKNKNKTSLKIKEKENAENMFLSLLTDKNYLTFYHNLVLSRHTNCQRKKDYITIENDSQKIILFPFIKLASLMPDDILNIFRKSAKEKAIRIIVPCNDYDKSCNSFIKNFSQKIVLLDKFETYAMLYKEYDFYPEITLEYKKESKPKLKELIAFAFNKSKTKGYLFTALILFITSFFVELNLYYCIIGSLLLLFALISFINPKYNSKKEQSII